MEHESDDTEPGSHKEKQEDPDSEMPNNESSDESESEEHEIQGFPENIRGSLTEGDWNLILKKLEGCEDITTLCATFSITAQGVPPQEFKDHFASSEYSSPFVLGTLWKNIVSVLSTTVKWKNPKSLLSTPGSSWEYQPGDLAALIEPSLSFHLKNWESKRADKQLHPLYLVFSGPGTGKSRLLEQFPALCQSITSTQSRLSSNSYTFNVSFENGTKSTEGMDNVYQVGTRMWFQLVQLKEETWSSFASKEENRKTPGAVVDAVARSEGCDLQKMNVFIMVDGIQELDHTPGGKDTPMKRAIDSMAELVNDAPFFCVVAIAGTFYGNVGDVLSGSPQCRVFLVPPPVNGHKIVKSEDLLVRQLIDDMGGHGRALETLVGVLDNFDITTISLSNLMNSIRCGLELSYPTLLTEAPRMIKALLAVLMKTPLSLTDVLGELCVGNIIQLGLFRLEDHILMCPFVFVWLLATWSRDPVLAHFKLDSYDEMARERDHSLPIGLQCWQHWEQFCAQFRILKSCLYDGQIMSMAQLHAGAILEKQIASKKIRVTKLISLSQASHRCLTATKLDLIKCEDGNYAVSACDRFFLNAAGAPAADGFCGIQFQGSSVTNKELHQNKHIKDDVTLEVFMEEYEKARRDRSGDFFLLLTTHHSNITPTELPRYSGLVSSVNFTDYFGPFAGRAFVQGDININLATRSQLQAALGIGQLSADAIINERMTGPFTSETDFHCRLPRLGATLSGVFVFPSDASDADVSEKSDADVSEERNSDASDDASKGDDVSMGL